MSIFSNRLTPAQTERLAFLVEELGEAQQAIGKVLRHGYESCNPLGEHDTTNRRDLERELGDVEAAISLLSGKDLNSIRIRQRQEEKCISVKRWMHHQEDPENE